MAIASCLLLLSVFLIWLKKSLAAIWLISITLLLLAFIIVYYAIHYMLMGGHS